jgi:hypothetical protein
MATLLGEEEDDQLARARAAETTLSVLLEACSADLSPTSHSFIEFLEQLTIAHVAASRWRFELEQADGIRASKAN